MQYWSICNILTHSEMLYFFRYIYKGTLVKISVNIAFLFYNEIYMKYLILYYNIVYVILIPRFSELNG
jgi:hypothetical protein